MYHDFRLCLSRSFARNTWSRQGPEIDVYDAMRPRHAGSVTASQHWIEPQSWPTRWNGRSPQVASATAFRSNASRASV